MPSSPSGTAASGGRHLALLFGGFVDEGHFNEIEFLYRALTGPQLRYSPADITVLNFDGTVNYDWVYTNPSKGVQWPGDRTPYKTVVNGPGTIEALKSVFAGWAAGTAGALSAADSLFLFFTGHGYRQVGDGQDSWIRCHSSSQYNPQYLSGVELASIIRGLPQIAALHALAQPCNSGGLVQPILSASPAMATTVAASCAATLPSLGGTEASPFSPFSLAWIAAIYGKLPDGSSNLPGGNPDTDGDGVVGAGEAFDYARSFAVGDQPFFDCTPASARKLRPV